MSENVATLEVEQEPAQTSGHAPATPFSEAELREFRAEDRHAGVAIVSIMMAIFMAALIAYTAICIWVIAHPNV